MSEYNYQPPNEQYQYYEQPQPAQPTEKKASVGLAILSLIIPLAGLIIFIVNKDKRPKTAKASGICAIVGVILNVVLSVIMTVAGGALFAGAVNDTINDLDDIPAAAVQVDGDTDASSTSDKSNQEQAATSKSTTKESKTEKLDLEKVNAIAKAETYLSVSPFSKSGLVKQLEYEGFSDEASEYAVNHIDVDWNEQAAKKAESYLSLSSFSRSGLIEQLKFEGFTSEQAEYAVSAVGY